MLSVVLGVSGFAFASVSGFAATHVSADTKIADNKVWVTAKGSDKGPAAGDFVRVISDCKDVTVWGNDLHNKSGDFTIYFDDHNGDDQKIDVETWKYDKDGKDQQVIATIGARELIKELKHKGFHAQDNGWHMDLQFKDPERKVEFILDDSCKSEDHGGSTSTPTPVKQQQVPPPVVKGTTTQAPKAIVAPQTGADAPFLGGMVLMSMGGAALGFARRLGRRGSR